VRFYFAGEVEYIERYGLAELLRARLLSFAYTKKAIRSLETIPKGGHVMLDSGAYTVFKSGRAVDLEAYLDFGLMVRERYGSRLGSLRFINLDVIPGQLHRWPTRSEVAEAVRQSIVNADRLRAGGLNVMEVYHQKDPQPFLGELLQRRSEDGLVALSSNKEGTSQGVTYDWLRATLREVLQHCDGPERLPRMHGLGIARYDHWEAFPWYSADATSWLWSLKYGQGMGKRLRRVRLPRVRGEEGHGVQRLAMRDAIEEMFRREREATKLWESRGVRWHE
jgi:hypothetical protein